MNDIDRRRVLTALCTAPVALSGCQQFGDGSPDGETPIPGGTDCAFGSILVDFDPHPPTEVPVTNATADGVLSNQYLSEALSKARREYRSRSLDDSSEAGRLVEVRGEAMLENDSEIREHIGRYEETYVEYRNVTFVLEYRVAEC